VSVDNGIAATAAVGVSVGLDNRAELQALIDINNIVQAAMGKYFMLSSFE
jgi:hypothetical protein